jgi:hypothetical protein
MTAPHIPDADILTAARFTLSRMTAARITAGMTPDAAFRSALNAFLQMCADGTEGLSGFHAAAAREDANRLR